VIGLARTTGRAAASDRRAGFTLIESLVTLAITSLVALSAGVLFRDGLFYFDRGTQAVDQTEQFALAVDCLTRDFGAVRFVQREGGDPQKATFIANGAGRVLFVTGGDKAPGAQGEEIVEYSVEQDDKSSLLVRRRAAWPGPRLSLGDADLRDPVVVLKGNFDISFQFAVQDADGEQIWRSEWAGDVGLPGAVRLALRDRESGADLLPDGSFTIWTNAPMACDLDEKCLSPLKVDSDSAPRRAGTN
jgi:prepilin-type N-terminal cleavage/methylation domain-containing protein